jgi:hypothetical protein
MGFLPRFRKRSLVTGAEWLTYEYPRDDGTRAFVAFDSDLAEEEQHQGMPHGRRVVLDARTGADGLRQTDEAAAETNALADSLVEALLDARVGALLVGTHRHAGRVEYCFQVEAPAEFDRAVEAWGAKRRVPWELLHHEGWSFFDEVLRPDERDLAAMEEAVVLERLREAGSDFTKPHDLEHVFLGTPEQLGAIADALTERGFRVVERDAASLTMARPLLIEHFDVTGTTMPLRRLAEAVGAEYDGWSCDVVRG